LGDLFTWPTCRVASAHVQAARLKASAHVPKHVLNTRHSAGPASLLEVALSGCWARFAEAAVGVTGPVSTPPIGTDEESGLRLDILFRDHRLSLMRYFMRNRASGADAEDLAQEAFLRLARVDHAPTEIAKPAAYLHQIGRNLLRDHAQAPARRHEFGSADMVDEAISEVNELGRLEARDRLRRVEAALGRLKPKTRNIFLAHRLDGMTYGEIAERTGLSVKGVEKQMSKAIAQLGRALDRN